MLASLHKVSVFRHFSCGLGDDSMEWKHGAWMSRVCVCVCVCCYPDSSFYRQFERPSPPTGLTPTLVFSTSSGISQEKISHARHQKYINTAKRDIELNSMNLEVKIVFWIRISRKLCNHPSYAYHKLWEIVKRSCRSHRSVWNELPTIVISMSLIGGACRNQEMFTTSMKHMLATIGW